MAKIDETIDVALFDGNGNARMVADQGQAAHVNYLTLVELGQVPSIEGRNKPRLILGVADMISAIPIKRLFTLLAVTHPEVREDLAEHARVNFSRQTGRTKPVDNISPTAPLLLQEERSSYVFTSDGYMIFGVRSASAQDGVGRIGPAGSALAGITDDEKPESRQHDSARILASQFGLKASRFTPLGINPAANPLYGAIVSADEGERLAVGAIVTAAYAAYADLRKPLAEVLPIIRLDEKHVGVAAIKIDELQHIAEGNPVTVDYKSSGALSARLSVDMAMMLERMQWLDNEALGPQDHPPEVRLAKLREEMTSSRAPRIEVFSHGERKGYALARETEKMIITAEDFRISNRDILAEALLAAEQAGFAIAPSASSYAATNAHMRPAPQTEPELIIGKRKPPERGEPGVS